MSNNRGVNDSIFDKGEHFWNNYNKGRPRPPATFFDRIFQYHESHNGTFDTVHDAGAGDGPYSQRLKSKFARVLVSDVAASNIKLARDRLGTDGFTYREAKVEEADDLRASSMDMFFATNVMHFPDQVVAMAAAAKQLKPGGTFAAAGFGPARFEDPALQDLWVRISQQGGRELLQQADQPDQTIGIMLRTQDNYNVAPLDPRFFAPGAIRVHLNMSKGGITGMLPDEDADRLPQPNYTGPSDIEVFEDEEGWSFETDLQGVKEHMFSFPFVVKDSTGSAGLFEELEDMFKDGHLVRGYWPAKVILATRR
nr:methyltransferase tpcm [Quercus suber]